MAGNAIILVLASAFAAQLAAPPPEPPRTAPAGGPQTKYCMRVEPVTGSLLETIKCWTREEWADQGVDVDKDWPKEGVRVIG